MAVALAIFCLAAVLRVTAMASFDIPAIGAVNALAQRNRVLDYAMQAFAGFDLFQGIPVVALACGAGISLCGQLRARLAIGVFGAGMASIFSRLLQALLPELPRPVVDPALAFQRPYGGHPELWVGWSSFPSDHATLLWGMAVATLMVNRRIGALSMLVAAVSSLARIYAGLHYPTDTIGGLALGVAVVCGLTAGAARWEKRLLAFATQRPAVSATLAFVFATQAANFFYDVRTIASSTARHVAEMRADRATERR